MKWEVGQCSPGDMIRVKIEVFWHYGVYVSDYEVIQFGLPPRSVNLMPKEDVKVLVTDIDAFSDGAFVEVAKFSLPEMLRRIPPKKTISLARSRVGEGGYDLLHNNCEHFAYECVLGIHKSEQEDAANRFGL